MPEPPLPSMPEDSSADASLRGVVERVTFHNPDSGYCVLRVQVPGRRDPATMIATLPRVVVGENLEARGTWQVDPQHGPQFRATTVKSAPPHTLAGITKYLASGLVKGIGPAYAKKITDHFGEQTLEIIDQAPSQLSQIRGLGPKRIERIRQGWQEQKQVHRIMAFLQSFGLGTARAVKIYQTYGEHAVETVRAQPYRLCADLWGIGFRTADELALKLGFPPDGAARAEAALRYQIREGTFQGHTALPQEYLLQQTTQLTGIDSTILTRALVRLQQDDEIVIQSAPAPDGGSPIPLVYLKPLFQAEEQIVKCLARLQSSPHPLPATDGPAALAWVQARLGFTLAARQQQAILQSLVQKILILTGGPGTGKTTIVRGILELYQARSQRVVLAAPTGRAAKRLAESTGQDAKTIHRLLEFDAQLGQFRRQAQNPLDVDLVVVDEFSMADVLLASHLLRAIPPWAAVVIVGDQDQLPSVGPGTVLADWIQCGKLPVVRLDQIHRQAEASWIIRAAHTIQEGLRPESAPPGGQGDFYFIPEESPEGIVRTILELCQERIPRRFGLDPRREIQVLSPMKQAVVGVTALNRSLQQVLNPPRRPQDEITRYGQTFRIGDKVLQTRNQYQRDVYNGDVGTILSIDPLDQVVTVEYDGRPVEYDFADLDELTLAYAMTIHKSQGSEYPAVVIPLHTQHWILWQRNLLYTAVTRGKRLVVLVGSERALRKAVQTTETNLRYGLLAHRLRQGLHDPEIHH